MLAGRPNPNDTPKKTDIAKTSKVLVDLTYIKIREEIIPNTIQTTRKVVLLRVLSVSVAPAIADNIAATKWTDHITRDVWFIILFRMLKAKEYHIKALDIRIILANAGLALIPNFPSSI